MMPDDAPRTSSLLPTVRPSKPYPKVANDWFVEPDWAVHGLFDMVEFQGPIWDPACGGGTIPRVAIARGYDARGTDLIDRGYGDQQDFLTGYLPPAGDIICNPPFTLVEPFLRRALASALYRVAFLLRLSWMEGRRRRWVWDETPLAEILPFAGRVSMPPGGSGIKAQGGAVAFAWFVWDQDQPRLRSGRYLPPVVRRIEGAQ